MNSNEESLKMKDFTIFRFCNKKVMSIPTKEGGVLFGILDKKKIEVKPSLVNINSSLFELCDVDYYIYSYEKGDEHTSTHILIPEFLSNQYVRVEKFKVNSSKSTQEFRFELEFPSLEIKNAELIFENGKSVAADTIKVIHSNNLSEIVLSINTSSKTLKVKEIYIG